MERTKDQDRSKGALEQDQQNQSGNTSMQGQLGHRDEDVELKNAEILICLDEIPTPLTPNPQFCKGIQRS